MFKLHRVHGIQGIMFLILVNLILQLALKFALAHIGTYGALMLWLRSFMFVRLCGRMVALI